MKEPIGRQRKIKGMERKSLKDTNRASYKMSMKESPPGRQGILKLFLEEFLKKEIYEHPKCY